MLEKNEAIFGNYEKLPKIKFVNLTTEMIKEFIISPKSINLDPISHFN